MGQGIESVDEATAVLSRVAAEQHALVENLDRCVNEAIARVQDMGALTALLERRQSQRVPFAGTAQVTAKGTSFSAQLCDLGEGGLGCTGAELVAALCLGDVVRVEFQLDARPVSVSAAVARLPELPDSHEVGLQFMGIPEDVALAVQAFVARVAGAVPDGDG